MRCTPPTSSLFLLGPNNGLVGSASTTRDALRKHDRLRHTNGPPHQSRTTYVACHYERVVYPTLVHHTVGPFTQQNIMNCEI